MSGSSPNSPVRQIRRLDEGVVIDLAGEIDLNSSLIFQHDLLKVLDERPARLVLNLGEVEYMDSSGIASLVKLLSRVKRVNAGLYLVNVTGRVRTLLEITRLDSVFDIRETETDALSAPSA